MVRTIYDTGTRRRISLIVIGLSPCTLRRIKVRLDHPRARLSLRLPASFARTSLRSHAEARSRWFSAITERCANWHAARAHRRRITAASSHEIARYITDETMARMVMPVITMFIL